MKQKRIPVDYKKKQLFPEHAKFPDASHHFIRAVWKTQPLGELFWAKSCCSTRLQLGDSLCHPKTRLFFLGFVCAPPSLLVRPAVDTWSPFVSCNRATSRSQPFWPSMKPMFCNTPPLGSRILGGTQKEKRSKGDTFPAVFLSRCIGS